MVGAAPWLTVEELTRVAFERSAVVMLNEARAGARYCPRTRRVGVAMVRAAHALGVRRLAVESITDDELPRAAKDLGWSVHPYEIVADWDRMTREEAGSTEFGQRRELAQAQNLAAVADGGHRVLVWCGNGHGGKDRTDDWSPMGWHFPRVSGVATFSIDQTLTVDWPDRGEARPGLARELSGVLAPFGGTAAILREDMTEDPGAFYDAYVVSTDNAFT
ncbi:hypothetical protein ACIB24_10535 [Spongisporangium articulatum]|uniref:Erythromycin esterase n=1 Tax=Spongisporangium articulatum TaxID=3362603 RepID=A0ABW8ANH0_9ACTN